MSKHAVKSKYLLKVNSKRIERNHIESKVHYISMNKAMTDEAVILPVFYSRRVKDQVILDLFITKTSDGYKASDNDDNNCNSKR